jgi:lipopolysaccharide/colanic/teichoic acid biosynthesis glycosyltransferase
MSPVYRPVKRAIDIVGALVALIAGAPVMAVIAVLVRWKLGSPVLFRQTRPGLRGESFELVKFRSMTDERGPNGELLDDAARLPAFGQLLRRTSLDELPEFWLVLTGKMSLVGPRPLLTEYLDLYTPEQARRHEARPGITGWAQVNGRNTADWADRLTMDAWYVDHASLAVDVRVLLRTVSQAVRGHDVQADGQATVGRFEG